MSAQQTWLAHLRHELRTPLNHIIGYTEMLLEDISDPNPLGDGLRRVHANARVVQAHIALRLGSMWDEAVAPDLSALAAELDAPVATMMADIRTLAQHDPPAGLPQLSGDLVRITSAAAALHALIATGLSLGLLPADAVPDEDPVVVDQALVEGGLILVVDDDRTNRELLERWLVRDGHRVIAAASGREALTLMNQHPVDLTLLDMMMPDMNGLQVLAALKADPAQPRPPVLMISAYDETHSAVRCIEAGAEDYLPKPFDRVLMRARVGACLETQAPARPRDRAPARVGRVESCLGGTCQRAGDTARTIGSAEAFLLAAAGRADRQRRRGRSAEVPSLRGHGVLPRPAWLHRIRRAMSNRRR